MGPLSPVSLLIVATALSACEWNDPTARSFPPGTEQIPGIQQRYGDPAKGYDYLLNGNYIISGIPLDLVDDLPFSFRPANVEGRTPINGNLPLELTAVEAPNGVLVAAPNCMVCHAQELMGETVIGLGNSTADFTNDVRLFSAVMDPVIRSVYGPDSEEWAAYAPLRRVIHRLGSQLKAEVRGINPGMALFLGLIAHRDPATAKWHDEPLVPLALDGPVPVDIPPWWLLKKKSSLYRTGTGRGDLASVVTGNLYLTSRDADDLKSWEPNVVDLLAWMRTLEPPPYPGDIDAELAAEGRTVFENNCSQCHGTYGADWSFPNLVVDLDVIGTDPAYAELQIDANQSVLDAFNAGPLGKGSSPGRLVSSDGYLAQPLDGIWASAPYLHNGSVPTLADLLDSSDRPTIWKRSFNTSDYDFERVGWNYVRKPAESGKEVYDTRREGYGNQGHTFGDLLTEAERRAVLEYLKTI